MHITCSLYCYVKFLYTYYMYNCLFYIQRLLCWQNLDAHINANRHTREHIGPICMIYIIIYNFNLKTVLFSRAGTSSTSDYSYFVYMHDEINS